MKKILFILLVGVLLTACAMAEETFFEEGIFDAGTGFADDSFFEEGAFFPGDEFPGDVAEEAVPEADAEDRSLVLLETDFTVYPGKFPWATPVEIDSMKTTSTPDGTVTLVWKHPDGMGGNIKLPKGVYYVVYDQMPSNIQNPLQVAKTTKTTVTLKNQINGPHTYYVRAESIQGGKEVYGERNSYSAFSLFFNQSTRWKTIQSVQMRTKTYSDRTDLYWKILTEDNTISQYKAKLTCSKGLIKDYTAYLSFQEKIIDGKRFFESYEHMETIYHSTFGNAKNFKLTVTPFDSYTLEVGKPKTAKLSKLITGNNWLNRAPVIIQAERASSTEAYLKWEFDDFGVMSPYGFEILDKGKPIMTLAYSVHEAYIPLLSAGKHKLAIRAYDFSNKKRSKTSAAAIITIPKNVKDIPVISEAFYDGSKLRVYWTCLNPSVIDYKVSVGKNGTTKPSPPYYGTSSMYSVDGSRILYTEFSVSASEAPLRILVEGYDEQNNVICKSDMIHIPILSSGSLSFTRQELDR